MTSELVKRRSSNLVNIDPEIAAVLPTDLVPSLLSKTGEEVVSAKDYPERVSNCLEELYLNDSDQDYPGTWPDYIRNEVFGVIDEVMASFGFDVRSAAAFLGVPARKISMWMSSEEYTEFGKGSALGQHREAVKRVAYRRAGKILTIESESDRMIGVQTRIITAVMANERLAEIGAAKIKEREEAREHRMKMAVLDAESRKATREERREEARLERAAVREERRREREEDRVAALERTKAAGVHPMEAENEEEDFG